MTREELKYVMDETELDRDPRDAEWVSEADTNEYMRSQRDEEINLWRGVFS